MSSLKALMGQASFHLPSFQRLLRRSLTVFIYHEVTDDPSPFSRECDLAVSTQLFAQQLQFIRETFTVMTLDELLAGTVPPRAALITFDDGFAGAFRCALPLLRSRQLPSTLFLNMGTLVGEPCWSACVAYLCHHVPGFLAFLAERQGRHVLQEPYVACTPALIAEWEALQGDAYLTRLSDYAGPCATPQDLAAVEGDPLVTFGNHGYRHCTFVGLPEAERDEMIQANAAALARYRNTRPVVAFPFGRPGRSYLRSHVEQLAAQGYLRFFTGPPRLNPDPQALVLHRVALTSWHDRQSRMRFLLARAAVEAQRRPPLGTWPAARSVTELVRS